MARESAKVCEMLEFNPVATGYTALPQELMSLPMSDGAFRTLVLLCSHASSETGECYPSQAQLAAMMGKSKGSVSAHVKELRGLGLVQTETQTCRHGGNYRLRYLVTFWRNWRAALRHRRTAPPVQPVERPVQPAGRPKEENHNQVNHTAAPHPAAAPAPSTARHDDATMVVVDDLVRRWQEAKGSAPFPNFEAEVPRGLIIETQRVVRSSTAPQAPPAPSEIRSALRRLWQDRGIVIEEPLLDDQTRLLARSPNASGLLQRLGAHLATQWPRHWRRMSTLPQFKAMIAELPSPPADLEVKLRLLGSDLRRHATLQARAAT
jgi:hypothetical protein